MKAYFIGFVIMGGCLLYGCHTKQKKIYRESCMYYKRIYTVYK